jgi:hypothetical protein
MGEANVYLPSNVGVIADAREASALAGRKAWRELGEPPHEKSGITIHLDIKGGRST